jgi:nicotinamide riboside kinase
MKIAIVGAFGTGKTTLFDLYRKRHQQEQNWAFAPEAARLFFNAHAADVSKRMEASTQSDIQALAKDLELQATKTNLNVLCDGSVFTPALYLKARGATIVADQLIREYSNWLKTYDLFVLASPVTITYQKDDVRIEDEDIRAKMHAAYIEFLKNTSSDYISVEGQPEERYLQLNAAIGNVLGEHLTG